MEPWAFELSIPAGVVCKIVGDSVEQGEFELVNEGNESIVWGWDGSNLRVYMNEVLDMDTQEIRVPIMSGNKTVKDVLRIIFRGEPTELAAKSKPWWKFWQ